MVSGRTVAALADRPVLARRRRAAVARPGAAGRPVGVDVRTDDRAWTPDAGLRLLGALADGLGLPATQVRPAYEDALGRLAAAGAAAGGRTGRPPPDDLAERHRRRPRRAAVRGWTSPSPRPGRLRAAAASEPTTAPAGPAPTGGCAAAGSCCSTVTRRPGCGCRWTSITWEPPEPTHDRRPAGAPRRRCPSSPRRDDAVVVDADGACRPPRWSPRSATGCCTSSCRRPTSSSTSSS